MSNRLPVITADMGNYGVQEIDFNEYMFISTDLVGELHKDAANYAYLDSVEKELKKRLKEKQIESDTIKGNLTAEVTQELVDSGVKKPTIAAVNAKLDADDTMIRFKQEILELEHNAAIVGGQLKGLQMRHSNIKKLVEMQLAEGRMANVNVSEPKSAKPDKKPAKTRGRQLKRKDN